MAEKVTLAEAKSLGFNSTEGITKQDGMYVFDTSLAPDRGGFKSVGIAKPGQVQMTPYYGDVTGSYMLSQEQFASVYDPANPTKSSNSILQIMRQNEIDALVKTGLSVEEATSQIDGVSGTRSNRGSGLGTAFASVTEASTPEEIEKAYQQQRIEMEQYQQRQSIMNILADRFTRYNLQSLIPVIKQLAQEGASESTITIALRESEEYKKRFKANQIRQKNNLTVLEPAEYLNLEDRYRQVLRAYGLQQFNNDNYVSQFIENDVSLAEFTERIQIAVQKVKNADQRVIQTLRSFYNINDNDLVAYVLDPSQQFPTVAQQFAVAEIGAAAQQQGIRSNVETAEQLARQGITQAEAQRGYATIANLLPTAEKLSQIYGDQTAAYTLTEAEQEVFGSLASAQRAREKLTQKEISTFSGAAGLSRSALSTKSTGGAF